MIVAQIIPANAQLEKAREQVVDIPAPQIAEEIYKVVPKFTCSMC